MGTLVQEQETDIDKFIRSHKTKLQHERHNLNDNPGDPSPGNRKQWERGGARDARPAEESRAQRDPEETGLRFGNDDVQLKKKQQLQAERHQEYNDMLAKYGPLRRRRPQTPRQEQGLPLGQYDTVRKALSEERQKETKMAMANQKAKIFDYSAAQKAHMAEKKQEYNQYLSQQKLREGHHIRTPEQGMFIGSDQSDRNRQIRQRNLEFKKELEKQQQSKLIHKVHETYYDPFLSPRRYEHEKFIAGVKAHPDEGKRGRAEPSQRRDKADRDVGPRHDDRARRDDRQRPASPYQDKSRPSNEQAPGHRLPIYRQDEGRQDDDLHLPLDGENERRRDPRRGTRPDSADRERGRSLERRVDRYPENKKEKYMWYNDKKLSPPIDLRRSRSVSPTPSARKAELMNLRRSLEDMDKRSKPSRVAKPDPGAVPHGGQGQGPGYAGQHPPNVYDAAAVKEAKQEQVLRMYNEQLAQKQRLLKEEYERNQLEDQRIAYEQQQGAPYPDGNKRKMSDEKRREYQQFLEKHPKLGLREKEVTPENLRLGLPLDQRRYDQHKRELETERHREYNELIQKLPPPPRRPSNEEADEKGIEIGYYDEAEHKRLLDEKRQEYNQLLAELPKSDRSPKKLEGTAATLPLGEYSDQRRHQLEEERHNEYVEMQQKKVGHDRNKGLPPKPPTPNHYFKNLGEHDRRIQMLNEERKKEYNQKLAEDTGRGRRRGRDSGGAVLIDKSDSPALRKKKELNDDYNRFLEEKRVKDAHRLDHKKPPTAAPGRHGLPPSPKNSPRGKKEYATLPGLHYTDSADKRKVMERNKEYNDYMRNKDAPRKGWGTPTYDEILEQKRREEMQRRRDEDYENEAPRMRSYASEGAINKLENEMQAKQLDKEFELRKVRFDEERRLQQQQQQGGILEDDNWLRPERRQQEYEQLTEQPREEQQEDMAARVRQQQAYNASLQVGHDESASAKRRRQADYRKDLELQMREFRAAKKREKVQGLNVNASGLMDPEKHSNRLKGLEGESGASPRREYKAGEVKPYHTLFMLDDRDEPEHSERGRARRPSDVDARAAKAHASAPTAHAGPSGLGGLNLGNLGNLGLGRRSMPVDLSSAGSYKYDEELVGLKSRGSRGGSGRFSLGRNEPPEYGRNAPVTFQDNLSDMQVEEKNVAPILKDNKQRKSGDSPRMYNDGNLDARGRGRRGPATDMFDTGLERLLESRRPNVHADIPPHLRYNASFPAEAPRRTYVTAGGMGGANDQVSDAYFQYGMKNLLEPLDPGMNLGLNLGGDVGGGGGYRGGSPTPRVTFADDGPPVSHRKRDRSNERISPYQFRSDDETRSRSRQDSQSYGAELERQIQEKRRQKMREREEQQRYEQKLEDEIKNYNPFGRGGGGAPVKDSSGNPVADLRNVLNRGSEPSRRSSPTYSPRPPSPRDDKFGPPPAQHNAGGETIYARGGHGIFGQPKTEAEKDVTDKYKDELRKQIEEKRRLQEMERQRERDEEAQENKRLEDQRKRMQDEYDEEQRKVRAREEEARKKNEELKQQAEERKREAERQRREDDDNKMREQQQQIEQERQQKEAERQAAERTKSPPIPTMKSKMRNAPQQQVYYVQTEDQRGRSPPLPAHRKDSRDSPAVRPPRSRGSIRSQQQSPAPGPSSSRPGSGSILTQLASMRQQLQNERKRVESALVDSQNEPDVFDPRLLKAPPNKVIFENAMNKNASVPQHRAQTTDMANPRNIQQFNELKYKTDTDSRRQFRKMFDEAPVTNVNLETQQQALLRQQEEQIKLLKEKNTYDPTPSTSLYHRAGNASARSQLEANSAFIDVDGVNQFPEDFEDMPGLRNDDARARRRDRFSPRQGPSNTNFHMGSQASLDVDSIQRKNDDRLRRLRQISTGDEISLNDPEDILERFMNRQSYNRNLSARPASNNTLQDDTWLRPTSKGVL